MPSENQENTSEKRFSHISVGNGAPDNTTAPSFDDEEVFDIGRPLTEQEGGYCPGAAGDPEIRIDAPSDRAASVAPDSEGRVSNHQVRDVGEGDRFVEDAENAPDYGIDDLPPMSFMQKIVLFALVAILVVVGAWLFNFYIGGSA